MATKGMDTDRTALVLYGTETGTSQDLAEEIGRLLQHLHFLCNILDCDSIASGDLPNFTIVVFVLATTGQGEFPSNSRKFWASLLRKKLTSTFLLDVKYALVGLGDSSYPKFNWAARKLQKRIQQLGAEELLEECEADEKGEEGTEGAVIPWTQSLKSTLLLKFPLPHGFSPIPDDVTLPSTWNLVSANSTRSQNSGDNAQPYAISLNRDDRYIPSSFPATLLSNTRVTPLDHWQDVRKLTFRTPSSIEYFPGDALSIMPKNIAKDVETLIHLMDWSDVADESVELKPTQDLSNKASYPSSPIPHLSESQILTLRILLTDYLDIMAIPRRSFFRAISSYTTDTMHKERLLEFTEPQYLDEYFDYATRPRRSIIEILQEFDSVKIPWQEAANVFPLLRPRQFSIASGGRLKHSEKGSTTFELLVAIVKYRTVIKRIREGVCTKYLARLLPGSTLNLVLKTEGRFHKKQGSILSHHILIGPGTGVAPLRALIYEKQMISQVSSPQPMATRLFFGARNSQSDFFFEDEWKGLTSGRGENQSSNVEIFTAFSRDQKAKVYVQDRIREQADSIRNLLLGGEATTVIVCGSSGSMPKAVRTALLDVLMSKPGDPSHARDVLSNDEAEQFLTAMEKRGCYLQETW